MAGATLSRPVPGTVVFATALATAFSSALGGCGGTMAVKPSSLAARRTRALAASHEADREFRIRWNPAQCAAPDFEVLLDGSWHRVYVDDLDDAESIPSMARDRLQDDDAADTILVFGELSSNLHEAGNKSRYMVLEIIDICPDTGCPPEED